MLNENNKRWGYNYGVMQSHETAQIILRYFKRNGFILLHNLNFKN